MSTIAKVAAVQMDPKIMKKDKNLEKIVLRTREAAREGAQLVVFPECALTGYVFRSREEALPLAETIPGPATERVGAVCRELGTYVVFGLPEVDGQRLYNAAAFIGPDGLVGKHRKSHVPFADFDRFVDRGDKPFEVYRTPIGNIGILICHDLTFPEGARILMLKGADIIVVPTNWPRQMDIVSKHVVNTRALENLVHIVAADRVGTERGARFLGQSKIVNARGITRICASVRREEVIYAELDLAFARRKRIVITPGKVEMDFINERRPEFYGDIARADAYQPVE